ncbi:MAG: HEPN domain-containing protein, partial [Thermofilum sp.]|nr:HEPN domain-containing protein [Thermofilum sp.]
MTLRLNPLSEVEYRERLAERYLADAEGAFERGDFRGTVASSQLAAENAAKAVVAVYRVPSWSHDPSHELREVA